MPQPVENEVVDEGASLGAHMEAASPISSEFVDAADVAKKTLPQRVKLRGRWGYQPRYGAPNLHEAVGEVNFSMHFPGSRQATASQALSGCRCCRALCGQQQHNSDSASQPMPHLRLKA